MKNYCLISFIFIIGVILRGVLFAANPCYVHDDAALGINIVTKNYMDFIGGLDFCQVSPPLFLMLSKFVYNILPKKYEIIDLGLKIIPFLSGIISIPMFYVFSKMFFKEKFQLYLVNALFCLNPLLICLCGRFKQYSTEVLIAIILYIIFYKYLTEGVVKKYWYFIVILAPWLSLSSLILLFSAFLIILFKNKSFKNPLAYTILLSILLFGMIFIPENLKVNYNGMNVFWSKYGFMSIIHPQRLLLRLGEFFLQEHKIIKTLLGGLVLYKIFEFVRYYKPINKMIFVIIPVFITVILSFMHLYPFTDRLIAFLLPLFIIMLVNYSNNIFSKGLSISFVFISFVCSVISISDVYNLPNYRYSVEQCLEDSHISKEYKPFYPVYTYYTYLNKK